MRAVLALQSKELGTGGQLTIELFKSLYPGTVTNFVGLLQMHLLTPELRSKQESEIGTALPPPLCGSSIARIYKAERVEFGTSGTTSFFGAPFPDEEPSDHAVAPAHAFGTLSMANIGPNTNASNFFICLKESSPELDGHHTIFGRVTGEDSLHLLEAIAAVKINRMHQPVNKIVISQCGVVQPPSKASDKKTAALQRLQERRTSDRRRQREEETLEDGEAAGEREGADGDSTVRPAKRRRLESTKVPSTIVFEQAQKSDAERFAAPESLPTSARARTLAGAGPVAPGFDYFQAQQKVFESDIAAIAEQQRRRTAKQRKKLTISNAMAEKRKKRRY